MTSAEKQEIRDVIQDCTGTLNVKIDLSLQQQKEFQDAVLQRLDKFNGRVYNLEKITGERSAVIQEFHDCVLVCVAAKNEKATQARR